MPYLIITRLDDPFIHMHADRKDTSTSQKRKNYLPPKRPRKNTTSCSQIVDAEKKNEMMELSLRPGGVTVEELSKELHQEEPSEGGKNDTLK